MAEGALEVINALQKRLEADGFTLYAVRPNDPQPTLVMYNTIQKRFAVIAFSPDEPGSYSRSDVWLALAESKAETFGKKEVSPYKVFKGAGGVWTIEEKKT